MQKSFWWWQCSDRYIISLFPYLRSPFPLFSPSLISRTVSVHVKHHVYLLYLQLINKQNNNNNNKCDGGHSSALGWAVWLLFWCPVLTLLFLSVVLVSSSDTAVLLLFWCPVLTLLFCCYFGVQFWHCCLSVVLVSSSDTAV